MSQINQLFQDMNRFFVDKDKINDDLVQFSDELAHQITNVLRLQTGDRVEVLDNSGLIYKVQLAINSKSRSVQGKIQTSTIESTEAKTELALCFGLSTREKIEWILQKATEIGIAQFYPFVSSRTLVQSTVLSDHKRLRWERIVREAAEQSHRARLPELNPPMDFEECVSSIGRDYDLSLLAWENASPIDDGLRQWIDSGKFQSIGLIVGPEGGFSEMEVRFASTQGCKAVSMGTRTLRMETAAIVLPAIIFYQLGDI